MWELLLLLLLLHSRCDDRIPHPGLNQSCPALNNPPPLLRRSRMPTPLLRFASLLFLRLDDLPDPPLRLPVPLLLHKDYETPLLLTQPVPCLSAGDQTLAPSHEAAVLASRNRSQQLVQLPLTSPDAAARNAIPIPTSPSASEASGSNGPNSVFPAASAFSA